MKKITLIVFALIFSCIAKIQAQCNQIETITICDMTTVDGDSNGTPDGIINLYNEYNAVSGGTPISLTAGTWFDPGFHFALDDTNGDLYLWDLDNSSESITDYQFQLIDTNSACPGGVLITVNLVLGAFEGKPLPPSGANDANITVCEAVLSSFDLYQVFESQPSAHENGVWSFVGNLGNPSNFIGLGQNGKFDARIPYVPGGDLIEFDVFEFNYTVPGIAPCSPSSSVNFKVEVIRDVQSGIPSAFSICEPTILSGAWDADIDLTDDRYLIGEDVEGLWSSDNDPTNQISGPLDSTINIREVFDYLKANNPKYGCETFTYTYDVEARSTLTDCSDKTSEIMFSFYEPIKPFQQNQPLEICVDGSNSSTINLYDQLEFTTENGFLYDYPKNECTNWEFVSGPSSLGIVSNNGDICSLADSGDFSYTSKGTINLSALTNADAGTYVFRYIVSPFYTCEGSPCNGHSTDVTVIVHSKLYAGEDTVGLQFCETDLALASPLDLFSLLGTNGIDDIYIGDNGQWINTTTGATISNMFTVPEISDQEAFSFVYRTVSPEGCFDRASLSFTVYEEYQAGIGSVIDVCGNNASFNLFDRLTGNPNFNGTWTGPNGYSTTRHIADFDPMSSEAGIYTYTVPDNLNLDATIMCAGSSSTITIILHQSPNAGEDMIGTVCQSDGQINLSNYLDVTADSGGVFVDLDSTNQLTNSLLNVSQLGAGTYNFGYELQGHMSCQLSISTISITVEEVLPPTTFNQTFCISDGATISDLQVSNGINFNWYGDQDSTIELPLGTALVDGEDYYVSSVDANSCESSKVQMTVTLLPYEHVDCDTCIKDGVSANGDGENDEFDLCNLPIAFPNFSLHVYNRYGTEVYKGNKNTSLFNGVSNVSTTVGKDLPTGIYFYVFEPKDGKTSSFQGNFYLSR